MTRKQARDEVNAKDIRTLYTFTESKGGFYVCPVCKSGTGKNHTGALKISSDGKRVTCFANGCFTDKGEDTLGALQILWNTDESGVFEELSIQVDGKANQNQGKTERTESAPPVMVKQTEPEVDYTELYRKAHADIAKTKYAQERGLSADTLKHFLIGFIAEWRHPKAPFAPPTPRLIIPVSAYNYIARDTRKEIPEEQEKYKKSKVGTQGTRFFNGKALESDTPLYIVEGEIDAMSLYEVGIEAVALGGIARATRFVEYIESLKLKREQPFIVALDNEPDNHKVAEASSILLEGLQKQGYKCIEFNPYGKHKDANEALCADRETFREQVTIGVKRALMSEEEAAQAELEEYNAESAATRLQAFINGIAASADTPCIKTGFSALDAALDGGFYPGLIIVGGLTSLGKTSLILQAADQAAEAGTDVLFFSLEMSESELMSKSISRHTRLLCGNSNQAKSARGITDGKRYVNYTRVERELINKAIYAYSEYANRIHIIRAGLGRIGVSDIKAALEKHMRLTGRKPLVIVDYLQIIRPESDRLSDKQATDINVTGLKNLSSDTNTAIIAISSLNRGSYKEAISMEALKESGGIEYGSDIVIGLQLKGAGEKNSNFDPTEAKRKDPRDIEAVILKNRNGRVGDRIGFKYYPVFNLFEEA